MEGSLINNIIDDEIIDHELSEGIEDSSNDMINDQLNKNIFNEGDSFIVIYEEEDDLVDKFLTVQGTDPEQNKIFLIDDEDNDEVLYYDENELLITKNEEYSIYEIEKVTVFDEEEIEEVDLMGIQENYPEIEIEVEELKDKIYSIQEKKESLITEIISVYKAHGNELLIQQIMDMVDQIMYIYNSSEDKTFDQSDTLDFIQKMIHSKDYEFPKWIIPIINNRKRLYKTKEEIGGDEELINNEDIQVRVFEEEFIEKYKLIHSIDDNNYRKLMHIIYSYSPYINNDSVSIPYHGF